MMSRMKLRSRDFITSDGVLISVIHDHVPLGTEYLVNEAHPRNGIKRMYNKDLDLTFEMDMVWVVRSDERICDNGGLMTRQVLEAI